MLAVGEDGGGGNSMALTLRWMTPEDNLGPFFGLEVCPVRFNPAQVVVAVAPCGRLAGMAMLFDGGHDIVMVDHVKALPPWEGKGLWQKLMRWIGREMLAQGKRALIGYAPDDSQVVALVKLNGGQVGAMKYIGLRKEL